MALNQTNKLVWIIETIHKARKISFEDLNRKWQENTDLSGGEEMQKRTFHKWKWNILDTFGLVIECEKVAPYRYLLQMRMRWSEGALRTGYSTPYLLATCSSNVNLSRTEFCWKKCQADGNTWIQSLLQ